MLDSDVLDSELSIDGYRLFRNDRNRNGGGVAIYVREDLNVVERSDLTSDIEFLYALKYFSHTLMGFC